MRKWFVSRQCYALTDPEDANCVEIAEGGIDYANADMLVQKYPGEGQEYRDPREAVKVALEISKAWWADAPDKIINVAVGYTMGTSMPFEGQEEAELLAWAEKTYQGLEKCPVCGEIMEGARSWYHAGTYYGSTLEVDEDAGKYCSEACAEKGSSWACEGHECDSIYGYKEAKKLSNVNGASLCPICQLWPCTVCGEPATDCDGEDHEYEQMPLVVTDFKLWMQQNNGEAVFVAVWADGSYIRMNKKPTKKDGLCEFGGGYNYSAEVEFDTEMGRYKSPYGHEIRWDEMPDACIEVIFTELKRRDSL